MGEFTSRPHVSSALAHLRVGVTGAAAVFAVCATVQLLVFGFVHFTHARFAEAPHHAAPIAVVAPVPHAAVPTATAATTGVTLAPAGFTPVATPRVVSDWDARMHTLSDMTVSAAVVAGLLMCLFSVLGTVIAGSAGVPGVEKAVSAAMWSSLVSAACLPWHDIMPSMMFRGAFGDYTAMAEMSSAVDAGQASVIPLFSAYLIAPLAAMCGALLVVGRFRQGVAEGVIVTSLSELDERLEREMAGIRTGGVAAQAPRAIGALNQAIGEKPVAYTEPSPQSHAMAAQGAPRKRSPFRLGKGVLAEDPEFKRPI